MKPELYSKNLSVLQSAFIFWFFFGMEIDTFYLVSLCIIFFFIFSFGFTLLILLSFIVFWFKLMITSIKTPVMDISWFGSLGKDSFDMLKSIALGDSDKLF